MTATGVDRTRRGTGGREKEGKGRQSADGRLVVLVIAAQAKDKTVTRYRTERSSALPCPVLQLQVAVRKAGRPGEVSLFWSAGSAGSAASARL